MIYKLVVQVVLLYGINILLVMDAMMTMLEVCYQKIAIRIAIMTARKGDSGELKWALVETVLEIIGVWTIRE